MDFIAIDLDKHDVWDAFRQPVPVKAQMYIKTANWQSSPPRCEDLPPDERDGCATGTKPKQETFTAAPFVGGGGGGVYEPTEHEPSHGFGGGGLTQEQMDCGTEQEAEAEIDALTEEIAEAIRNLHNENTNPGNAEFGSLILRLFDEAGNITYVRTGIGRSANSDSVGLADLYALAERMFPGINGSNVVRVVHLHPAGGPNDQPEFRDVTNIDQLDARDYFNTLPSHPNITVGQNDWVNVEQFLRARGLESTDGLSQSILGPDGVLREYDYIDGHPADESGQVADAINNAEADAAGDCN